MTENVLLLFFFYLRSSSLLKSFKKNRSPKTFETSGPHNFSLRPSQKKSGIQLRSQIVWTFHFWSPFNDPRHPLAVRWQCLKILSGKKKQHIKSGLKKIRLYTNTPTSLKWHSPEGTASIRGCQEAGWRAVSGSGANSDALAVCGTRGTNT